MTSTNSILLEPIEGASFGARCSFADTCGAEAIVLAAEENHQALLDAFYSVGGLLVLEGLSGIEENAALLLRISTKTKLGGKGRSPKSRENSLSLSPLGKTSKYLAKEERREKAGKRVSINEITS